MVSLLVKSIFALLFASIVKNSIDIQMCTSLKNYENEGKATFPSYIPKQKSGTPFIDTLFKNGETEILQQYTKTYVKRLTLSDGFVQIFEVEESTPNKAEGVLKEILKENPYCSNEKGENAQIGHHIGSDCLLQIESCVTNNRKFYFFGKKFQGDMKMPKMIESFTSKSTSDKLKCFKNISEHFIELRQKNIYHLNIDPKFIIVENMDDCKFLIRMSHKNFKFKKLEHYRTNQSKYTAPENIPSIKEETQQAEVYSLGMLFLVMMTSEELVFNKVDDDCYWIKFTEKCHNTLTKNLKSLLLTEIKLKNLLMKAIKFNKAERQETIQAFYNELLKLSSGILV